MAEFVHLHTHTHYSMQSSTIMPPDLFAQCQKLGMKAVAITDYASMFNMPELFGEAKKKDVKLIIGSEIFVVPGSMSDKKQQEIYHLVLLVKNEAGYQNMCRILSAAARDGFYQQRPRVDLNLISANSEGLICLTACEEGALSKFILHNDYEGAIRFVQTYKEVFKDDFYIELQSHNAPNDEKLNQAKIRLAEELSIKVVATNDVHYLEKKDAPLQDALQSIRNKQTQANSNRPKLPTEEFYLKSADEMARVFNDEHQELTNTLEIAEKCTFKFQDQDPRLPHFEIPEGFKDDSEYLTYLTFEGAKRKYGDIDAM
ncbi:MAG: PHP domain-containing protein, partial [Chlorobiales bacterium]|nr:PHP domain-containing protein [Chlorobiales bacterium]